MAINAQECLAAGQNSAKELLESYGDIKGTETRVCEWTIRFYESLIPLVNDETILSDEQAKALKSTISSVGQDFMSGSSRYKNFESTSIDNTLLLQIATYVNSCTM